MNYVEEYGQMHARAKILSGYSLKRYIDDAVELVGKVKPESILDYGSGKGYQYLTKRMHERWGGPLPWCFDVGVPQLSARPEQKFDGVICTDVLEHIERGDIDWFLDDVLSFLNDREPGFALLTAACRPAKRKTLSDGRNVHVTIEQPEWWEDKIRSALSRRRHPHLLTLACFDLANGGGIERRNLTRDL